MFRGDPVRVAHPDAGGGAAAIYAGSGRRGPGRAAPAVTNARWLDVVRDSETETWRTLAEQVVYARPSTEQDGRAALEWIAFRDGKTLEQVVQEIRIAGRG